MVPLQGIHSHPNPHKSAQPAETLVNLEPWGHSGDADTDLSSPIHLRGVFLSHGHSSLFLTTGVWWVWLPRQGLSPGNFCAVPKLWGVSKKLSESSRETQIQFFSSAKTIALFTLQGADGFLLSQKKKNFKDNSQQLT